MSLDAKIRQETQGRHQLQNVEEYAQDKAKLAALEEKVDTINLAETYVGPWDAAANLPALTAVPGVPSGQYYRVTTEGTSSITGESRLHEEYSIVVSDGQKWIYYPAPTTQTKPLPGSVGVTELDADLASLNQFTSTNWWWGLKDRFNRVAGGWKKSNAKFWADLDDKMVKQSAIDDQAVGADQLETGAIETKHLGEILASFFQFNSPNWHWSIKDKFGKVAGGWKKKNSKFWADLDDEIVKESAIKDKSVTLRKLEELLQKLLPTYQQKENSPYSWDIRGGRRIAAFIRKSDGKWWSDFVDGGIKKRHLDTGAVSEEKLDPELLGFQVPKKFEIAYGGGWIFKIVYNRQIVLGIRARDLKTIADFELLASSIKDNFISAKKLEAPFRRLNDYNRNYTSFEDDGLIRGKVQTIPAKTKANGYHFGRFAPLPVKSLRVLNSSNTTLQIRQSGGLPIRGERYRGTFDPTASEVQALTYKGNYGNSASNAYPAFPVGNVGDGWMADAGMTTATKTANSLTFKSGDYIVQTGSGTYAVQSGPGDGSFADGDFWVVTKDGSYGDMLLKAGDVLVNVTRQTRGGPTYVQFILGLPGEFFVMGECAAGFAAPATLVSGMMWHFSADATLTLGSQTITGKACDSLIYEDGFFGLVPGNMKELAPGELFTFIGLCDASELEIRRKDKSSTVVSVTGKYHVSRVMQRFLDALVLFSDSMFGQGLIGSTIVSLLSPRAGIVESFGGSTSYQVLGMMKKKIRSGDPYAGRFHTFWHGQNNQTDTAQIFDAALQMAGLVGSQSKNFMFWSVLGQRNGTFNADKNRIYVTIQEEAFAGTNHIAKVEQWYEQMFPGNWWSPRKAILAWATSQTNVPDLQFPGLSIAQTAAAYGVLPLSFFLSYASLPVPAASWNFKGYWSTASAPTGGVSGDYYIVSSSATGAGGNGFFWLNSGGSWVNISFDVTHVNTFGGPILAGLYVDFLTSKFLN